MSELVNVDIVCMCVENGVRISSACILFTYDSSTMNDRKALQVEE